MTTFGHLIWSSTRPSPCHSRSPAVRRWNQGRRHDRHMQRMNDADTATTQRRIQQAWRHRRWHFDDFGGSARCTWNRTRPRLRSDLSSATVSDNAPYCVTPTAISSARASPKLAVLLCRRCRRSVMIAALLFTVSIHHHRTGCRSMTSRPARYAAHAGDRLSIVSRAAVEVCRSSALRTACSCAAGRFLAARSSRCRAHAQPVFASSIGKKP